MKAVSIVRDICLHIFYSTIGIHMIIFSFTARRISRLTFQP